MKQINQIAIILSILSILTIANLTLYFHNASILSKMDNQIKTMNQTINEHKRILAPYDKINRHITEHSKLSQSMSADVTSSIVIESHRNGLEPEFVTAVIGTESEFNPMARSKKGACGLMQLMPSIAKAYNCHDVYDVRQNIAAGCKYLSDLRKRFREAKNDQIYVMSFNCGPNRPISQIVRLSGNYAGRVNRGYRRLKYGKRD